MGSGEWRARRRSAAVRLARLRGPTCFPRASLKASGKGNCHCRAWGLLFVPGVRPHPALAGCGRTSSASASTRKVLPERARAKPASAWRYGSGCTKDTATARTVCLLAGRRLGKGSVCPAGQAARTFEDRLQLLSKASAPLRRRANSSRGKIGKSTRIAKQSRDSLLKAWGNAIERNRGIRGCC